MKRPAPKWALVLALMLATAELCSAYFGGWAQGHMTHHSLSGSCDLCIAFGSTYFWADAGDSVEVHYDVTLEEGEFHMWVNRMTPGQLGDSEAYASIDSSGPGTWRADIARGGWHHLVMDGASHGRASGYDLKYSTSWRIHRK